MRPFKVDEYNNWHKSFDELPENAKKYNRISELTKTKIDLISTSPRREDTIQ